MNKYKGRKKYTEEEAGKMIENIPQQFYANKECINYWTKILNEKERDNAVESEYEALVEFIKANLK